jgi:HEAT repeat protein
MIRPDDDTTAANPNTPTPLGLLSNGTLYSTTQRVEALGQLAERLKNHLDPAIIMVLLERIRQDTDMVVVTQCIGVLGRLQVFSAISVLIDVALGKGIALFKMIKGVPKTEQPCNSENGIRLRCAAVQALGRMGDTRAIVPLMSLLDNASENYRLRLASAESLGKLGDQSATKPLLNILESDQEKSLYLKESAAKALGMLGDIRALEPLIDILESKRGIRDKFNFLKEQIILSIGRIGQPHKKATHSLLLALDDEAPSIRLAAIEALAQLDDVSSVPRLIPLLHDADDDVALAAVAAVAHLGGVTLIKTLLQADNLPQFVRDELEGYIP